MGLLTLNLLLMFELPWWPSGTCRLKQRSWVQSSAGSSEFFQIHLNLLLNLRCRKNS